MGKIKPEEFNTPSKKNPYFSSVEYDLHAKTGLSIRKNLIDNRFEIFVIKTGLPVYHGTIEEMVAKANEIEGAENTWIGD